MISIYIHTFNKNVLFISIFFYFCFKGCLQRIKERLEVSDVSKLTVEMFIHFFPVNEELIMQFLKLKSHSILDSPLFGKFFSRDLPKSKTGKRELNLYDLYGKPVQSLAKFLWDLVVLQKIPTEDLTLYFTTTTMALDELEKCCLFLKDIEIIEDPRFNEKNLVTFANKIACVVKSKECLQFADDALNVQDKLELKGDFSEMKNLKSMVSLLL